MQNWHQKGASTSSIEAASIHTRQLIPYKSHHVSGNQTRKLSLNTMTCTPEHGSVKMTSQSLIAITKTSEHLNHPKSQYNLKKQLTKCGALRELYEEIRQKLSLRQTDRTKERTRIITCSLMRILV